MGQLVEKAAIIEAVKAHALANYNTGGWDFIVECWDDSDLDEAIGDVTTVEEAIRHVGRVAGLMDERRAEVQAEVF